MTTVTSPAVVTEESTLAAPSRRKARRKKNVAVRVLQFLVIVALFGSWQLLAATKVLNPSFVSEPSEFFPSFWHGVVSGSLLSLMGATLYATFVGFAAAAILGLVAGYLFSEFKVLDMVARPFMTGFNSVPRIALAPLFVLWFGLGSLSVIVLIVSLSFFIVSFNTYAGLQSCSRDHLLLARTLGAGRFVRFTKFVLPSATPAIFAGLQLALTYAFLGAVVGEMLQGSQGLGGYLALQMGTFETTGFFGGLTLLIIVALIVAGVVRGVEKYLLRWKAYELRGTQG
jgi:NitT/TauT family transport system permease protein